MNLASALYAWAVQLGFVAAALACCVAVPPAARALRNATRWIWNVDRELAAEMRIRAAEQQDADDLATCQAIAALPAREPRRA